MDPMRKEVLILTNKGLLLVNNGKCAPHSPCTVDYDC